MRFFTLSTTIFTFLRRLLSLSLCRRENERYSWQHSKGRLLFFNYAYVTFGQIRTIRMLTACYQLLSLLSRFCLQVLDRLEWMRAKKIWPNGLRYLWTGESEYRCSCFSHTPGFFTLLNTDSHFGRLLDAFGVVNLLSLYAELGDKKYLQEAEWVVRVNARHVVLSLPPCSRALSVFQNRVRSVKCTECSAARAAFASVKHQTEMDSTFARVSRQFCQRRRGFLNGLKDLTQVLPLHRQMAVCVAPDEQVQARVPRKGAISRIFFTELLQNQWRR